MGETLTAQLTRERESKVALVNQYAETAADEGRDLSENEIGTITKARARVVEIDAQLDVLADDLAMSDEVATKLRALGTSTSSSAAKYRSAGEVVFDLLHQGDDESRRRWTSEVKRRAAEHMGTEATQTVPVAGDLGGLVVTPVVGAVIDPYPRGMPLANAVGLTPSPSALHFMRPKLLDPSFATGVAEQTAQKAELASKKFDVVAEPVALDTVGGYLNISQQLISLQAGSLDLIVGHMNRRLSNAIDVRVAGAVTSTGATPIPTPTNAQEMNAAIYTAAAQYFAATGQMPQWIAAGPLGWALLGSFVDSAGRPLFPYLGASNALGTSQANTFTMTANGLPIVVTPAITDDRLYVGGGEAVEGYLFRFPVLEAVEPSVLGRQVAVAAAVGTYLPIDDAIQVIGT